MTQDAELVDAVAVIGMSCRFSPDLDSPDRLWAFLRDGRSVVSPMPDKRWDPYASSSPQATAIMRTTTRLGSFLDDIEGFDADFFGISPREADFLDPQQRIMLELAWEALVNAGVPPLSLRGSETGVFVAANSNDYGRRLLEDIPHTGAYAVNGTTYYGIANRISYFLDLRGPSVAVDTACAGSLTALHYACQELRLGGSSLAVVGGVNVMATPALFVALDAAGATSPDGRSKAFDRLADGYGRGEGAGVVVLKRLADARRDGDPVLALIMGSGVFQDGRSDGMMAPNSRAQEHMLRQVYRRAGIAPGSVGYVEAHGTGTPTGDREEALALASVFGEDRPAARPCLIGSLKPNIGHIEGGSGIAGLIKAVLALRHGEIPPSVHSEPHPGIDWDASGLRLVARPEPWSAGEEPRRAGVSSYGVGGTIAHLIVQEAPLEPAAETDETPEVIAKPMIFLLSAMSDKGLRGLAADTADLLAERPALLASVGYTLAVRRSHLAQRAAIIAATDAELTERLRALANGEQVPGVLRARIASGAADGAVWVFSGHGAQWSGMGRRLLRDEPVFADVMDELADVFRAEMGWTPREAIEHGGPWTAAQIQALTFAMQVGLAQVWRSRGVEPGAVIGHSVGEIAAAVAAGCLDVQEAARFACRRATALRRVEGPGGMALAGISMDECRERLGDRADVVAAIAASPRSTVISGDREAVAELMDRWRDEGVPIWRVDTDIAFHSPHVQEVVDEVTEAAEDLRPRPARVRLYSTALADPRSLNGRDSGYWADNLRRPVRFAQAIEAAVEDGHTLFLEISSHPVVTHSIMESLEEFGVEYGGAVATLRRDTDELGALARALAELHCLGGAVDWTRVYRRGSLVPLPAMAWQHRPYWIFPEGSVGAGSGSGHDPGSHTLLGGRMTVSGAPVRQVWQTHLDLTCRPYPQSHEVVGVEITPAACIIDTFATAAARGGVPGSLSDIVLRTPVAVTPPRTVQVVLAENSARLATRIAHDGPPHEDEQHEWITHCTAVIDADVPTPQGRLDLDGIRARCTQTMEWDGVDRMFRNMGVGGYAFPWDPTELRRNGDEQLAVLTIEPDARTARSWAHVIDGALTLSAVVVTPVDARRLWMSCHVDSVAFRGEPPARISVHSARSARSPHDTVDVQVAGEDGEIVLEVRGLRFAALQDEFGVVAAPRDLVHEIDWRPLELDPAAGPAVTSMVLVGDNARADRLAGQVANAGVRLRRVASADDIRPEELPSVGALLVVPDVGDEAPEREAERTAWALVRTAQRLSVAYTAARDADEPLPRLWCVSEGVRDAVSEQALAQAPLWGVSRIIAGEHPELWGGLVDVPAVSEGTGADLLTLMAGAPGTEDVLSLPGQGVEVPRLVQIERADDAAPQPCAPSGTYLVTGGLGALGLAVAQWLVDRGARRILLASRRGLPPREEWDSVSETRTRRQIDAVLALEALGATVRVLTLDIADADQVAEALDPSSHGLPPVRGIVHAAGVVMDALVDKVDQNGLREVLVPKAVGAMVLHRLFPPGSLDFFVLFSSCGQFARLTGQTSYAAANSFLDVLAAHRRVGGRSDTVSLGWTSWRGMGMSETLTSTLLEANSRGLDMVSAVEAFRSWSFADRFDSHYKAIVRVLPLSQGARRVPMFRELAAVDAEGAEDQAAFTLDWENLDDDAVLARMTVDVREQVAAELNLAAEDVELRRPLVEFGVDSVMTVALRVRLQLRYGIDLPPNILWNKPSVAALAEHLAGALCPQEETAS